MRGSWLTSVHHVLVYLFLDGQLIVCLFYTLFDGLVDLGVRYLAFLSPQLFRSLKLNVTNTEQDKKWPTPNRHSANGRNFVEERYIPSLACESISWIKDTYIFFKTDIIFCEINSFSALRTYRLLGRTVVRESVSKSGVLAQDARDRKAMFQQENLVIRSKTRQCLAKFTGTTLGKHVFFCISSYIFGRWFVNLSLNVRTNKNRPNQMTNIAKLWTWVRVYRGCSTVRHWFCW